MQLARGRPRQREETHLSTQISTTPTNPALAREYLDRVFNAHRPELAAEYLTPDVKWHGGTLGTIEGPDNVVALLQGFIGGLPDLNAVEQDALAQGDLVAMRFVINATHGGSLFGVPPTATTCSGRPSTSTAWRTGRSRRSGRPTT
jgi:predicted SnoaL-like aldol condensation-catalyzing enzyme